MADELEPGQCYVRDDGSIVCGERADVRLAGDTPGPDVLAKALADQQAANDKVIDALTAKLDIATMALEAAHRFFARGVVGNDGIAHAMIQKALAEIRGARG